MKISKKTAGISAAAVIVLGAGAYFLFLSPKSTTLEFKVAAPSLAANATESVTGAVSPAAANRVVVLEQKSAGGAWKELDRAPTDVVGEFKFAFPMTEKGKSELRARVTSNGRQREAAGKPVTVKVLDPTVLEVQVPKFARTDRPLQIPGRVSPASARTVTVETSPDGQTWTAVGGAATNAADGKFSAEISGLKPGPLTVRVTVDATDTAATAAGAPASVSVEDYKAAGQQYLAIVKSGNDLIDKYNKLTYGSGLASYKKASGDLSRAMTAQARAFRNYAYWPQEVKGYIALLEKADTLDADNYNQDAKASSLAEIAANTGPDLPKGADNAAALTRAALGLPKR